MPVVKVLNLVEGSTVFSVIDRIQHTVKLQGGVCEFARMEDDIPVYLWRKSNDVDIDINTCTEEELAEVIEYFKVMEEATDE